MNYQTGLSLPHKTSTSDACQLNPQDCQQSLPLVNGSLATCDPLNNPVCKLTQSIVQSERASGEMKGANNKVDSTEAS